MPLNDWLDHHRSALEWLPFASMWLGTRATDKPALTRTLEELLKIAAAAALAIYVNDKLQDQKIDRLDAQVREYRDDTRAAVADLRADVRALVALQLKTDRP